MQGGSFVPCKYVRRKRLGSGVLQGCLPRARPSARVPEYVKGQDKFVRATAHIGWLCVLQVAVQALRQGSENTTIHVRCGRTGREGLQDQDDGDN